MWKKIKGSFLTGLVVILPIILTIAILNFLVRQINTKVLIPFIRTIGLDFYSPHWMHLAKGASFLIIILLIALIGGATRLLILRKFFSFWEGLFLRVPTVGKIYITIKQISQAFLGQGKQVFKQVVLVEYPRKGIYSLGFVTTESCAEIKQKTSTDSIYVFLPTSPNPTNGFFLILPKKTVIPLKLSVADGFKLIVSGGTFTPEEK